MKKLYAYFRLMRFHQPIGILLLWAPTAWALWIANQGCPSLKILLYFILGTLCMRAAGCVINDIADRHVDKHVARTQSRPLTAGDIDLQEACLILLILLGIAAVVVLQLPSLCFEESLLALFLTGIYPFCKRFIRAPQLVLGLAFSMGIPMAYAASGVNPNLTMALLFILNALWILMYDTCYALIDREDDYLIGVKSTAILFGIYDRLAIGVLQICVLGLWLVLGYLLHRGTLFYGAWGVGAMIMLYQQKLISLRTSKNYFRAFAWSGLYGLLMWIGLL